MSPASLFVSSVTGKLQIITNLLSVKDTYISIYVDKFTYRKRCFYPNNDIFLLFLKLEMAINVISLNFSHYPLRNEMHLDSGF